MSLEIAYPFFAAILIMSASLSGVLLTVGSLGALIQRNLTLLATFSAGVFAMVIFELLKETLHESTSLALAVGAVLFGAAFVQALHHLLPDVHHHHTTAHGHSHSAIDGRRVLVSDAFHNMGDGVLLVASFAVSWPIGIAASVGILIHELVQEVSEYFILREAGYLTREALLNNLLSASTILLGVGIAAFLASAEEIAVLFAGVAAGGFLTTLVQDLIPHSLHSMQKDGGVWKHAFALGLGVLLMLSIQAGFPHEETAEENQNLAFATQLAR